MSRCDAELCPYWGGDACLCEVFGIDPPGPGAEPFALPSATYTITTPTPSADAPDLGMAEGENDERDEEAMSESVDRKKAEAAYRRIKAGPLGGSMSDHTAAFLAAVAGVRSRVDEQDARLRDRRATP